MQHARILAGPGCSLKIQAQPSSAKVGHFQLKKPGAPSSPFWLEMAENCRIWLEMAAFWLKMAENVKMAEFWLKMAEFGC